MNEIPPIVFIAPILTIAVAVYMVINKGRAAKNLDAQWTQYRAGELATRLGLQLVKGDPAFNLFIRQANVDVSRGPSDGKPVHVEVLLEGEHDGSETSLRYLYRVEQDTEFTRVVWRIWHDCRMTVRTKQAFPEFEVVSRKAPMGPIAKTKTLVARPTGNAVVDKTYVVMTNEKGMADALGQHLEAFSRFEDSGVHLVGDGEEVSFVMKQDKAPLLANALYYAEDMQRLLVKLAQGIGG